MPEGARGRGRRTSTPATATATVDLGPASTGTLVWCDDAAYFARDPQRSGDPATLMRWAPGDGLTVAYESPPGRRSWTDHAAAATRSRVTALAESRRRAGLRTGHLTAASYAGGRDRACRVHRLPRRGAGLLRRPRGRQHQVVLGEAQGRLRRGGQGADDRAVRRARAGVRRRQDLPPLPRRPLREGQDAVQDPPGRVRAGRRGDRVVRRGVAARASAPVPASTRRAGRGWRRSARLSPTTGSARSSRRSCASSERQGFEISGDRLKTSPRGYDADHPRIELLRHRSLSVGHPLGFEPVIHTPELLDLVRADWRRCARWSTWVATHTAT